MTYFINSNEARSHSRANLNIFDEVNYIMRQIIVASDNGDYQLVVDDSTLMTESTPLITITGTVADPTITNGETLIIGSDTITLGASGTNLNAIIADINDENIPTISASKNASDHLVITVTTTQLNWAIIIGTGTANTNVGITDSILTAPDPTSVGYYESWAGVSSNRKFDDELSRVSSYFTNLGYNISISKNPNSLLTIVWNIFW